MRIGDSFEDMKRKMLSLQPQQTQPQSQQQQQLRSVERESSKPNLPTGGSRRAFSPDADLSQNLDPVPFPSLDKIDNFDQTIHTQQQQQNESRPSSFSTPLRGIALNSRSNSYSNSNSISNSNQQKVNVNIVATKFVSRIFEITSGHNYTPTEHQNTIDISCESSSENNSWINNLVLTRRRSSRRVSPAPSNDQCNDHSTTHDGNIENSPQNSARSRKSFDFKALDFSTPNQTSHNIENDIHQYATLFVHSILPHQ